MMSHQPALLSQGLHQELKLLTEAKQAGLAKLKECSLQQQALYACLEEQHNACAANNRQLDRLSKQNEALQVLYVLA